MKKAVILCLAILCISGYQICSAQDSVLAVIRNLEDNERLAVLKGDTTVLLNLMSPAVVVNNPENAIIGFEQIKDKIRNGKIDYLSLDRYIEKITLVENIAIVMGKEVVKPKGSSTNTGKQVTRRFTNIWMKTAGSWKLTARQATIIAVL